MGQQSLFDRVDLPPGFIYRTAVIRADEERELLAILGAIEFVAVEMRGVVARRRTAHYGWKYGYYARRTEPGDPLPGFLLPLRERMAAWAEVPATDFEEALITEYPPGAA